MFRLYGGPMHGQYVALDDNATQLKVTTPDRVEFYVNTGWAGRLDYQPHPH
jgi:hypothetical protein